MVNMDKVKHPIIELIELSYAQLFSYTSIAQRIIFFLYPIEF